MDPQLIVMIIILMVSVVIHEIAHGFAANWLGDPTARLQGRLSPNPLVHIDPLGSVIVPGLMAVSSLALPGPGLIFGWAKPVPYNPYNFTNQKWGEAIVAIAGPASNVALAVIFAVVVRLADILSLSETFIALAIQVIVINILLALFNLIPIPPLDGSKIFPRFLPRKLQFGYDRFRSFLDQNFILGFVLVLFVMFYFLLEPLRYATFYLTSLLIG